MVSLPNPYRVMTTATFSFVIRRYSKYCHRLLAPGKVAKTRNYDAYSNRTKPFLSY